MNLVNADSTTLKGVVIPDAFKQPEWVEKTFNNFIKSVKEDYIKNKMINPSLVRKYFKHFILDDKISPAYPLNKKNISKL